MRVDRTGEIVEDFYVLGHPFAPVYFLSGPSPAIFDAGFTAMARLYERDIKNVLGNHTPAYLFLTHTHWDHVGTAGHFKVLWPEIQIAGSGRAQEVLARPGALRYIRRFNQDLKEVVRAMGVTSIHEEPFVPFEIDQIITPGETIELGPNTQVKAIYTPGHTWDFMSYWIPEKKILIASEAVGCDFGSGEIETEFLVDYDAYGSSIEKLAQLDVQVLCQGHGLVFTGPDAKAHLRQSPEQAKAYVAMVEEFLQAEGGNVDKVVTRVKAIQWAPKPWPKQPESAYMLNTRARVRTIRDRLQKSRGQANLGEPR